jgi:uncharacterized protein YozE (UPF0346 family)
MPGKPDFKIRYFCVKTDPMKRIQQILFLATLTLLISCSAPKPVAQYNQLANNAFDSGYYQKAISYYDQFIYEEKLKGNIITPDVFVKLAQSYYAIGQINTAVLQYEKAKDMGYESPEMYRVLSRWYAETDNLSRELSALEAYDRLTRKDLDSLEMKNRLFNVYIKSENWEKAKVVWPQLSREFKASEENLNKFFVLNKTLTNDQECDEIAEKLILLNQSNAVALEWLAKKYYNAAEDRYQKSMANYNSNKTNSQYKILLKELDQSTADFKVSLKYFDKLWNMENGKKYAAYLANIYARFDDKAKSDYFKSLVQ